MSKNIDAFNYPLRVVQGTTFIGQYTLGVEINCGPFEPTDISNATITGAVKKNYDDPAVLATFTTEITDGPSGQFRLTLTDEVSETLPSGSLKYDVRANWSDGSVQPLFRGNLYVLPGIE